MHWCRRQVRFKEVPEKVPKVPQEKVPGGFGAGAGSGSTDFRKRLRRFRRRFWEALVQSQVRFNMVPEKVPGGFGAGAGSGSEKFVFLLFSPTAYANGVFSPDMLRCAPVQAPGQVQRSSGRFQSIAGLCSPGFRKVPEHTREGAGPRSTGFRKVLKRTGASAGPARFNGSTGFRKVPEHTGAGAGFQSGLRFRRWRCSGQVQVKSGSRRFWRAQEVPARFGGEGSEG